MICKWTHKWQIFEFDARDKAEEKKKVRAIAKEYGYRFKDMVKEVQGGT